MNKKLKTIIEDIFKMESTDLNAVVDAIKMRRNQLHTPTNSELVTEYRLPAGTVAL